MKLEFFAVLLSVILIMGASPMASAQDIPDWIKQTVKWYSEGTVSEQEFLSAIKFLIKNKILVIEEDEILEDPTLDVKQVTVTKPKVKQCEILFQSYKNIGIHMFKAKYKHITYLDDCVKLYRDSIWKYQGNDRHDKLFQKLVEFEKYSNKEKSSYEPTVKINSIVNVGKEKYDVKFNVCAGSKQLDKARVLIKSQIESIELGTNKDIPVDTCRTHQTQINAKNPDNIFIDVLEQVLK